MNLYIVVGTNGLGNSGMALAGVYPTLKQAKARIKFLTSEDSDHGFEHVFYDIVKKFDLEAGVDTMVYLD